MSRITHYKDSRLTVIGGVDHMLGIFFQLYDRELENETPEGEGIVLEWSEGFGYERNLTGIPNKNNVLELINEYVAGNKEDEEINFEINLN